jgi:hypothetical protein
MVSPARKPNYESRSGKFGRPVARQVPDFDDEFDEEVETPIRRVRMDELNKIATSYAQPLRPNHGMPVYRQQNPSSYRRGELYGNGEEIPIRRRSGGSVAGGAILANLFPLLIFGALWVVGAIAVISSILAVFPALKNWWGLPIYVVPLMLTKFEMDYARVLFYNFPNNLFRNKWLLFLWLGLVILEMSLTFSTFYNFYQKTQLPFFGGIKISGAFLQLITVATCILCSFLPEPVFNKFFPPLVRGVKGLFRR